MFARFRVNASGAVEEQAIPIGASLRRAPALEGLGLLERVATSDIARHADPNDTDRDGISGRMPSGRFGWKGRMPDLTIAVAAAFVSELGLSNPYFAERNSSNPQHPDLSREQVESVADYVRALPPPQGARLTDRNRGATAVFARIGCAKCHRPAFQLQDRNGNISVNAYTDLLLHDMGPALADGIVEGNASGQEFRPQRRRRPLRGKPVVKSHRQLQMPYRTWRKPWRMLCAHPTSAVTIPPTQILPPGKGLSESYRNAFATRIPLREIVRLRNVG